MRVPIDTSKMRFIRHDGSWDLYIDNTGQIWFIAIGSYGANGFWGDEKHYFNIFGEKIPA